MTHPGGKAIQEQPVAWRHRLVGTYEWNISPEGLMENARNFQAHFPDKIEIEPLYAESSLLTLQEENDRLKRAIRGDFCVLFLDGRNEHGTHVLGSYPRSFALDDDDIFERGEEIMKAAEALGFAEGDHIWARFHFNPAQVDGLGRTEYAAYWDFSGIDAELSKHLRALQSKSTEAGNE